MSYAAVRPDAWNFPLFLHVPARWCWSRCSRVAAVVLARRGGRRRPHGRPSRLAFRTLLIGAIPAYLVMRVGAEWIADKENLPDSDASWIGIGYSVADGGLWC